MKASLAETLASTPISAWKSRLELLKEYPKSGDEEHAQVIVTSWPFENEFIAATAQLPADEDDIYSVVADPLLRNALKPGDD